jgi:myosin-18
LAELRESEGGESSTEVSLGSLNTLCNVASTSRPLPPVPPLPPKRGILKQVTKTTISPRGEYTERDSIILVRNTLQNEVIAYQNIPCKAGDFEVDQTLISPGDTSSIGSGEQTHSFLTPPVLITNHDSVESLEDSTTNSSFVTPPFSLSPVGDSHGLDVEFPLPEIQPNDLSEPRTLTIQRQPPPRSDFGFSLRKAMIFKRDASGNCHMKPVILAEPGTITQHCNDTGLLPGDRLLQVNGQSVDKKTREEVIDMIKSSGTSVTLKVR